MSNSRPPLNTVVRLLLERMRRDGAGAYTMDSIWKKSYLAKSF